MPLGRVEGEIVGAEARLTVMLRFFVAVCEPAMLESVAATVKLVMPLGPVGKPVICPVEEFKLKPVGRLVLPTSEKVIVPVPPAAMIGLW